MDDLPYLLGRIEQATIELPCVVNGRFADGHSGSLTGAGGLWFTGCQVAVNCGLMIGPRAYEYCDINLRLFLHYIDGNECRILHVYNMQSKNKEREER